MEGLGGWIERSALTFDSFLFSFQFFFLQRPSQSVLEQIGGGEIERERGLRSVLTRTVLHSYMKFAFLYIPQFHFSPLLFPLFLPFLSIISSRSPIPRACGGGGAGFLVQNE